MNRALMIGLLVIVVAAVIAASSSLYTVHQAAQALVLEFGKPISVVQQPGLHVKVPFIQNVRLFDKRVLDFDAPAEEVIASDQKRLVVDAFARYKIVDPLLFFQSVRTERDFQARFASIVNAATRQALGTVSLQLIVSGERVALMGEIKKIVNGETKPWGVEVIDVRIKRTDLPKENSEAIFRRMQTSRQKVAKEIRAEGDKKAQVIRAEADRQKVVTIANARKTAQITRGKGDAQAVRIFADAFGQDVDFFTFYRSMQAYRAALGSNDTTMVLSPDSEFFRFFGDLGPVSEGGGKKK